MLELLQQIESILPGLPHAQRKVGRYILENYKGIPFLSVTALAREIGVSDTTVIKFCMHIGFDGFGSFKRVISEHVQSEVSLYGRLENKLRDFNDPSPLDAVLSYDLGNIEGTLNNPQNRKNFEPLLNWISEAREIYTLGFRSSALLADYLSFNLRQQNLRMQPVTPGLGDYVDRLHMAGPRDLCIAVSFARYSSGVVRGVEMLHKKGVPCVLITDSPACPICRHADMVFFCETKSLHNTASHVGCLSLMNAIITGCLLRHREAVAEHIKELDSELMTFEIFRP